MEIYLVLKVNATTHVGFHCNVSLLYWRVYNFDIVTLEKKYHEKDDYLHVCHSPLESSSSPPLTKNICRSKLKIDKNNDFQVRSLFWGPPFSGFVATAVDIFRDRGCVQRRTSAFRRFVGSFDGTTRSEGQVAGGKDLFFFPLLADYFWTVVRFWGGW